MEASPEASASAEDGFPAVLRCHSITVSEWKTLDEESMLTACFFFQTRFKIFDTTVHSPKQFNTRLSENIRVLEDT